MNSPVVIIRITDGTPVDAHQIKKNRITRSNSYNKFKIPELENRNTTPYADCWAYTLTKI